MVITLRFVLLLFALIAFVLGAVGVQSRVNLTALGLALCVLHFLVT